MSKEYPYSTKLKNRIVQYRKWKVKDKKNFVANKDNPIGLKSAIVYNCVSDDKAVFTTEEYKFILAKIREVSIKEPIVYDMECDCGNEFVFEADLDKIMTGSFKKSNAIDSGLHKFAMADIQNRDYYENTILANPEEAELIDFIFSIKTYNNGTISFEEMNEIINEMDLNDFEDIMIQWNALKFKLDNTFDVDCPKCKKSELYEFDDLPNFFPGTWEI